IWDSEEENWAKVKDRKAGRQRGGPVWLAQDCISASNLTQAEKFLNTSMKEHPKDYKVYCALGFINVERNDFNKAKYYFSQPLDLGYAKTKPQKILLLFLISRLYDLDGDSINAEKKIRDILLLNPQCPEALYQNIIFGFHQGRHTKALAELKKLIHEHREYYVNALIDPELTSFSHIIHPELEILLDHAKEQAKQGVPKAEEALKRLKKVFGENEKEVAEVQSLLEKIEKLSKYRSYLGYLDIIQHANSIVSICRRNVEYRRKKIFEFLYNLNDRCRKHLTFTNDFPYKKLVRPIHKQLKLIQTEIEKIKNLIESDTPDIFRKAFSQGEALSEIIDDIDSKLKRLDNIREIYIFSYTFFKISSILQAFNLLIAFLLFPIITHYLNFILPALEISHKDLWFYQKGFLIICGILALFLALLRTIKKLYPE
ncbi:MAG: hypothetical protein SV375_18680, partial [Thermodesulfobacteriota bacterium]|nr:hypothetical protein [Thermodesulfobacteriota bacterium]